MSLWNVLVKRAVGIFQGLTAPARNLMRGTYGTIAGEPPVRGTQQFLQVYETSPWVRAIAGLIGRHVGATEWTLGRSDRPNAVIPADHLAYRVLRRPNPFLTGHATWKLVQLSLDLVGDAFLMKARNGLGAPIELWPIPAHWVAETPTPDRPSFRISWASW